MTTITLKIQMPDGRVTEHSTNINAWDLDAFDLMAQFAGVLKSAGYAESSIMSAVEQIAENDGNPAETDDGE